MTFRCRSQPQFDTPLAPPPSINPLARKHVDELGRNDPDAFFQVFIHSIGNPRLKITSMEIQILLLLPSMDVFVNTIISFDL